MKTYRTAEVAAIMGVHPNTVRLYERLGLIPAAERKENGYRVFTGRHLAQFRLARLAFRVEVLQNGLRRQIVETIKTAAAGDYAGASALARVYVRRVRRERAHAEEAAALAGQLLSGAPTAETAPLRRKEVSAALAVSMDTLRNWEMNGLLTVKRRENGYRVYTGEDVRRLKIIRALRCANYSLEAILRLLRARSADPEADVGTALNTPGADDDIVSACDRLIISLGAAEENALAMLELLRDMQREFE